MCDLLLLNSSSSYTGKVLYLEENEILRKIMYGFKYYQTVPKNLSSSRV